MFKKSALMAAFGIGYVLGARAGRERYDALAAKAQKMWHDPRVQDKAHRAGSMAKQKAEVARETVQEKMPGSSSSGSTSTPTSTSASSSTPTSRTASSSAAADQTSPITPPSPSTNADPVTGTPRGWES